MRHEQFKIKMPANDGARPALIDVYPPFRERMKAFQETADKDAVAAAEIFREASEIAKAFWAGVEYACGVEE